MNFHVNIFAFNLPAFLPPHMKQLFLHFSNMYAAFFKQSPFLAREEHFLFLSWQSSSSRPATKSFKFSLRTPLYIHFTGMSRIDLTILTSTQVTAVFTVHQHVGSTFLALTGVRPVCTVLMQVCTYRRIGCSCGKPYSKFQYKYCWFP